jgi:Uma2 family endonuclease
MTADDLLALGDRSPDGKKYELIAGRLIVSEPPPGLTHGRVQMKLGHLLTAYVLQHRLGTVVAESGAWITRDPDTVVGCDLSFIRAGREREVVDPDRYIPFAPDLAVEVRSPGDRKGREVRRVARLLDAGVRLVWHVEPRRRRATVHAPGVAPQPVGEDDLLEGRDVVPGFACRLRDALDW